MLSNHQPQMGLIIVSSDAAKWGHVLGARLWEDLCIYRGYKELPAGWLAEGSHHPIIIQPYEVIHTLWACILCLLMTQSNSPSQQFAPHTLATHSEAFPLPTSETFSILYMKSSTLLGLQCKTADGEERRKKGREEGKKEIEKGGRTVKERQAGEKDLPNLRWPTTQPCHPGWDAILLTLQFQCSCSTGLREHLMVLVFRLLSLLDQESVSVSRRGSDKPLGSIVHKVFSISY